MLRFMLEANAQEAAQLPILHQLQSLLAGDTDADASAPPRTSISPATAPAEVSPALPTPTATSSSVAVTPSVTAVPMPTPSLSGGPARSRDDGYVMPALPPPPLPEAARNKVVAQAHKSIVVECQFEPESEKNIIDLDKYKAVPPGPSGDSPYVVKTTVEMVPVSRPPRAAAAAAAPPSSMLDFITHRCGEPSGTFPTLCRLSTMLQEPPDELPPSSPNPSAAGLTQSHTGEAASTHTPAVPAVGTAPVPLSVPLPVLPGQSEWGGVFVAATPPPALPFSTYYQDTMQTHDAPAPSQQAHQPVPLPLTTTIAPAQADHTEMEHETAVTPPPRAPATLRVDGKEVLSSGRARPSRPPSSNAAAAKADVWQTPHHATVAGRNPPPASTAVARKENDTVDTSVLVMEARGLTRRHKTPYAERFMRALYYRSASTASPSRKAPSRQRVVQRLYDQIQSAEQLESTARGGAASPVRVTRVETPTADIGSSRVATRLERDVQRAAAYGVPQAAGALTAGDEVNTSLDAPSTASSGRGRRTRLHSMARPPLPSSPPPSSRGRTTRPPSARPAAVLTPRTTTTAAAARPTTLLPRPVRGTSASSSTKRALRDTVTGRRTPLPAPGTLDLAIVGEHVSLPTETWGARTRPRFQC